MEITMEYSYFSDSLQNYLVLECPEQKDRMNYQYRMLSVNTIRGLLPSSIRTIDGIQYLYYDITSRQDLQSLYTDRYIPDQMWQCLLRCLARTGKTLSRFLLDEKRLQTMQFNAKESSRNFTIDKFIEKWEKLFNEINKH